MFRTKFNSVEKSNFFKKIDKKSTIRTSRQQNKPKYERQNKTTTTTKSTSGQRELAC